MVAWKHVLLCAAAAAASTVTQVVNDITVLDNNVKALIAAVATYPGGYVGAAPQLVALIPVYTSLLQGVADSGTLPPSISTADTYAIIDHVNETLAIDNPIAVKTLESKKALYKAAGLDDFLVVALGLLKLGHESFTANVLQRIPPATVDDAKKVTLVISLALQDGIDTFEAN